MSKKEIIIAKIQKKLEQMTEETGSFEKELANDIINLLERELKS